MLIFSLSGCIVGVLMTSGTRVAINQQNVFGLLHIVAFRGYMIVPSRSCTLFLLQFKFTGTHVK